MIMRAQCDALVIGAGPAGSTAAILLAQSGWRVSLVEQHAFPRQKVCGECISAGSLTLLDDLGVGPAFQRMAGPELRYVGWMGSNSTIIAEFPPCLEGNYRYGRAVGRDRLDELLLERARHLGVNVLQPAKVRSVRGSPGNFVCELEVCPPNHTKAAVESDVQQIRQARIIVDAHGSWEAGPELPARYEGARARVPKCNSDLFAFKASFRNSNLEPGFLPVIALEGGYGGIVVADGGRTTLACCIRRDRLRACRESAPGAAAGTAIAAFLLRSCVGVREALDQAILESSWLSVGPIRPGMRVQTGRDIFKVGNAAGETHPLIGEGISMALQSAQLLAGQLLKEPVARWGARRAYRVNHQYGAAWRTAFAPRLRFAAGFAHAAMRPVCAAPVESLLRRWPSLLTRAAQWAGKAQRSAVQS
jgi:flavin-dependent dehydrogenase